jgi:hypothetical protein
MQLTTALETEPPLDTLTRAKTYLLFPKTRSQAAKRTGTKQPETWQPP